MVRDTDTGANRGADWSPADINEDDSDDIDGLDGGISDGQEDNDDVTVDEDLPPLSYDCPVCDSMFDNEQGLRTHFGKVHKQLELTDDLEVVSDDGENNGENNGDGDGHDQAVLNDLDDDTPVTPDDEDDDSSDLDGRSRKRVNAVKAASAKWDDALEMFAEAATNGMDTTRRDARADVVDALQTETDWMSIRERSELGDHDLWMWSTGDGWQEDASGLVGERMVDKLGVDADDNEIKKICQQLAVRNKVSEDDLNGADDDGTLIAFANGVIRLEDVDLDNDGGIDASDVELLEEEPEMRMTRRLNMPWNPDTAVVELAEEWMESLTAGDGLKMKTLWEAGGHALLPRYDPQGFIAIVAQGSNGKTTLFNVYIDALGKSNTTAIPIDKITGSKFSSYRMVDRLANMHADISSSELNGTSALKAATGDDRMEVERKGQDPWDARNRATQIMAMNEAPRIGEQTTAIKRRLMPVILEVEFVRDADPDDPFEREKDDDIEDKLTSEEGLAAIAVKFVEAARRLQTQGEFSMTLEKSGEERLRIYRAVSDPVDAFELDCLERDTDGPGIAVDDIKACYDAYALANDHAEKTKDILIRTLKRSQTTVMRRSDPRSWTDDSGRTPIYKGMAFSEKARENWLPEDAHWSMYGGRPDDDEAVNDEDSGEPYTPLDDVTNFDPGRHEGVSVRVAVAHELDAKPWLHHESVVRDASNTMRVQSIGEHRLIEGETYVISDFTVVPADGDTQIQLVPAQTDITIIDAGGDQVGLPDGDDGEDAGDAGGSSGGAQEPQEDAEGDADTERSDNQVIDREAVQHASDVDSVGELAGRVSAVTQIDDIDRIKYRLSKLQQSGDIILRGDDSEDLDAVRADGGVDVTDDIVQRIVGCTGPAVTVTAVSDCLRGSS